MITSHKAKNVTKTNGFKVESELASVPSVLSSAFRGPSLCAVSFPPVPLRETHRLSDCIPSLSRNVLAKASCPEIERRGGAEAEYYSPSTSVFSKYKLVLSIYIHSNTLPPAVLLEAPRVFTERGAARVGASNGARKAELWCPEGTFDRCDPKKWSSAQLPGLRRPTEWHAGFCDVVLCPFGISFDAPAGLGCQSHRPKMLSGHCKQDRKTGGARYKLVTAF